MTRNTAKKADSSAAKEKRTASKKQTPAAKAAPKSAAKSAKSTPAKSAKATSAKTAKTSAKPAAKSTKAPAKSTKTTAKPASAAKRSPKKTAKPRKSGEEKEKNSSMTPQVMKLVESEKGANQVIAAGKSFVPRILKGRQPLSRVLRREVQNNDFYDDSDSEVVNLTELAVKFEAPQILDRFNACSCEKCVKVFSETVLKKVPPRFARISRSNLGVRSRELHGRVEPVKKMVLIAMIRELIGSKKRLFHDEEENTVDS